ncbi:MAG TPA: sodium/solute symporter [Verrucomicrobiae bacterium]|jgi:SSS family transporter
MASPNLLNTADWAVILLYIGGIVALGTWFGRDQHQTRDYFLGGKDIPWWGIGLSIVAAETSALTIIGVPAMAYGKNGDLSFIQLIIGYVIARIILAVVMVPHYLKGEIYSPYQLFSDAFGENARRTAGGFFLLSETLAAGVRVYVASIPVKLMLGEKLLGSFAGGDPILGAILLFVVISLLYTFVGGVKAVIWMDAMQFGLFLMGGLFTLWFVPHVFPGGVGEVFRTAESAEKLHWLNADVTLATVWREPMNIWMGVIGGTFMVLASHGAEQLIVQRVLACKNVRDGRRALVLSAVFILPLFLIFLLVGAMLWVYYQKFPIPVSIPEIRPGSGIKANDFIYPIFMLTGVPHVLKGLLIVAILAAAMSSVSSALTALSSVSTMDFLKKTLPGKSDAVLLKISKVSTVFWALALIFVAYLSRQVEFVLNASFMLRGLTSGGLLGGLILAVFWKSGASAAVIVGMLCSLAVMFWISPLGHVGMGIAPYWYTMIGCIITIVVALAVRKWVGSSSRGNNSKTI